MEDVENLVKTSLGEIQKLLSTKTVIGEPIVVEGATLIPLVSIGFGFGAGGGQGKGEGRQKGEGMGGGSAGGAGIRPIAIIIIHKDGSIKVESIKGGLASALDRMADMVPQVIEKWKGKNKDNDS